MMRYTELQVTTNFSFLRGASHPEELVQQALALGYSALGITDRNTLAGIVRAHAAAKKEGLRIIVGCRLDLQDGPSLLAYPMNKAGYAALTNLLTTGNLRAEKGDCYLFRNDVFDGAAGLKFILVPPAELNDAFHFDEEFIVSAKTYRAALGNRLYMAAARRYAGDDAKSLYRLSELSSELSIPLVATNDVHYHEPGRRQLQDVVTCIREGCTIHNAGFRLHSNAERYLKSEAEMIRLFHHHPETISNTEHFLIDCCFSLDELTYEYPEELTTGGRTNSEELAYQAWKGAYEIFGAIIPEKTKAAINHELAFIQEMNYAPYFLTVHDIVRFARSRGILCQGRGSAANSTVCFCLGITSVNPEKFDLLFERFLSAARNEPPDIDVDFEHERREEVIQYIYQKWGRDRAAIVATVTQQHHKGAIRDVGKAMGLSLDVISRLSADIWEFGDEGLQVTGIKEQGLNAGDKHLRKVLELTKAFIGFPRQLGQHTGGFVITRGKLSDLCPILNARMADRTCIEWNKDDIDALGFMKIDVLALGMLTCIRKAFDLCKMHYGLDLTLANIPQDDPAVYEMISHADTIGVFQIESRAQQTMLPRLKPKCFYDLVIEVAIVRPGPIQGDMVHPYLRRRNGEEKPDYPSPELEEILKRTLGVPLFQEQAMKIAVVAAGFTLSEADELRRSMATFKVRGMVAKFQEKLTKGMAERGYSPEYAQRVFRQLEGFGSYGFPESHAASFALLVYVSSWIKCYYPDVFACALLNSMPMGFYQPAQLVIDARNHGVEVRPVDINHSEWDHKLEEPAGKYRALRLGFRLVKGLRSEDMALLLRARVEPYTSVNALRDAGLSGSALEKLADADAFRSIGLDRRQALWEVSTRDRSEALFKGRRGADEEAEAITLPLMTSSQHVVEDYASTSLSIKAHPVSFAREKLSALHVLSAKDLKSAKDGQYVKVAGLVLVRQRPGTAGGVCFITIEDETGFANLVVFKPLFESSLKTIMHAQLLMAEGKLQVEGEVIHVIVSQCYDLTKMLRGLTSPFNSAKPAVQESAEQKSQGGARNGGRVQDRQEKLFGESRDFK